MKVHRDRRVHGGLDGRTHPWGRMGLPAPSKVEPPTGDSNRGNRPCLAISTTATRLVGTPSTPASAASRSTPCKPEGLAILKEMRRTADVFLLHLRPKDSKSWVWTARACRRSIGRSSAATPSGYGTKASGLPGGFDAPPTPRVRATTDLTAPIRATTR